MFFGFYRSSYLLILTGLLTVALPTLADTYYVSPTGNDNNSGTLEQPFRTIRYAISQVDGGDTIYLRGGTYFPSRTIRIEQAGGSDAQRTRLFAYRNERPIIDGSRFREEEIDKDLRDNAIFRIKEEYWHLRGLEVRNGITFGITINGTESVGNHMEQLVLHDNGNTGLAIIGGASQTRVLNCDAYRNFNPNDNGQNGDGFSAIFDVGTDNKFEGCRAWANADDGYDLWKANNKVVIDRCWAYNNGFDRWQVGAAFAGNGEGFKLGRNGGAHLVKNCLAWGNRANGYLSNSNTSGVTVYNSTGWNNQGLNFSFYGPERHVLRNCINYSGGVLAKEGTDDEFNSWNLSASVNSEDFQSVSDAIAVGPRASDGSLPTSGFLRLADGSDLIDQGTDVGLPFAGSAPDLGAYETEATSVLDASNGVGRTEAEAMDLNNYEVANWTKASGGGIVQMDTQGGIGSVGYRFTGQDGEYDLAIRYLDEPDGASTFTLLTNDVTTRQWAADQVTEGGNQWKILKVSGVFLRQDSRIEIQAGANRGEFARLDYVEVTTPGSNSASLTVRARGTTGEEVMALRIDDQEVSRWNVTTDWVNYTYDGPVDGNVKVAFVNDLKQRGKDRNLRVDYVRSPTDTQEAEAQAINTGAWQGTCGGGRFSERLECNGYIDFGQVNSNARRAELLSQPPTDEVIVAGGLKVYPNPVDQGQAQVTIQPGSTSPSSLLLTDTQGRVVLRQTLRGVTNLDVRSLPSGVYLLRIGGAQETLIEKLVVQ